MRFAAKVNIYTKENIRSERTDNMYTCMINGVIYVCGDGVGLLVPFFTTGNISNVDVHFSWRSSSCHTLIPIRRVNLRWNPKKIDTKGFLTDFGSFDHA